MPNQGTFSKDGEVLYLKLGNSYTDAYICQNCLVYIKTYHLGDFHSSVLAWRIPGTGAWWAAVYGVTQSWTQLT